MIKLYLLLKRGRIRKKGQIYKRLWMMSFDVTIIFYTLILAGYIVFAIYRSGTIFTTIQQFVLQIEAISVDYFWVLMTVIPLGMLLRTFSQPGISISTAEYTATTLPYTKQQIWWMAAGERWLRLCIILCFIGGGLWFFSPTSGPVILMYIGLLLVINIVMTVIEWRVFQLRFLWKVLILALGIGVNLLSVWTSPPLVAGISGMTLILVSAILIPRNVHHINWEKVTAACDYKIWNMFLVSYMTKQKMKKQRSYTWWQRLPFWRNHLPYRKESLYHRLWHIYFQRQIVMLLQFIGTMLVLVGFVPVTNIWIVDFATLLGFSLTSLKPWFFFIALALAIHMYASFVAVIWKDRLTADIVQVLPWDVWLFHRTLQRWALGGSVIFLLPIGIFASAYASIVFFLQILIAICAFGYLVHWKRLEVMRTMTEEATVAIPKQIALLGYGLLILMIASAFLPYLLIVAVILLCLVGLTHIRFRRQ